MTDKCRKPDAKEFTFSKDEIKEMLKEKGCNIDGYSIIKCSVDGTFFSAPLGTLTFKVEFTEKDKENFKDV